MADELYDLVPNKKAKSEIWKHFLIKIEKGTNHNVDNVAVCKHCNESVKNKGGTSNLRSHMTVHHPLKLYVKKCGIASQANNVPYETSKPKAQQQTMQGMFAQKYATKSDRQSAVTKAVAKYIIDDLRPLSVVEGQGFQNMINTLDPRYTLPGRTYFSKTLIPSMYEEAAVKVKQSLSLASAVALTTDGWTSRANQSYITITSVHVTPEWDLQNFVLQTREMPDSHTGTNIASTIREAIVEWNLPNAKPPLVSDNAANMIVAGRELNSDPHIGCFAHTLNLAAQSSLKLSVVSRILGRARKVVSFFHRSTTATATLKQKTHLLGLKDLNLITDVPTRWNSAADMLERYLQLQPAIYATLVSRELNKGKDSDIHTLNENDTAVAEAIMECLLPLRDMTNAICSEKTPTVSVILPLIRRIRKIMSSTETDLPVVRDMKRAVTDNLFTRYTSDNIHGFLEKCTVLDPRFKDNFFESDELYSVYHRLTLLCAGPAGTDVHVKIEKPDGQDVQPARETETPKLPVLPMDVDTPSITSVNDSRQDFHPDVTEKKKAGLASIFDDVEFGKEEKGQKTVMERALDEISRYKEVHHLSMTSDPLKWWKENEILFPLLTCLAKKRLCIPATSVPSDRIFSTAGDIITAQRATLSSGLVDKLIFLKKKHKLYITSSVPVLMRSFSSI